MIDLESVRAYAAMKKREDLLNTHPYKISHYSNGDWGTYLPDNTKPHNRRFVRKKSEDEIKEVVIEYWREKDENPTIKEVFTVWNDRRLELGKIANSTHFRNQQIFNRHFSEFGNKKIKSVTQDEIEDFLEDKQLVLQLMGHTMIGTTERNYHRNRRTQNEKIKIVSAIPEFAARAE